MKNLNKNASASGPGSAAGSSASSPPQPTALQDLGELLKRCVTGQDVTDLRERMESRERRAAEQDEMEKKLQPLLDLYRGYEAAVIQKKASDHILNELDRPDLTEKEYDIITRKFLNPHRRSAKKTQTAPKDAKKHESQKY